MKKSLVVSLCLAGLLPLAVAAQSVTPLAVNPVVLPTPTPEVKPIPVPSPVKLKAAGKAKSGSKAKATRAKPGKAGSAKRAGKVAAKLKPRLSAKKGR